MRKYIKVLSIILIIISLNTVTVDASSNPQRIAGDNRIRTAIEVSKKAYQNSNAVVLAGYDGEVDALSGTILAYSKNAPMLLTGKDKLHELTLKEIERLKPSEIYILGGENVISKDVEDALSKYKVTRVGGKGREGTAIDIAKIVKGRKIDEVFLTLGYDEYADALAVGPISARQNKPILLTKTQGLPKPTKDALKEFGVSKVTIIGGEQVVNKSVEKDLENMNITVNRVFGKNRMETALNIAKEYTKSPASIVVANGYNYADAVIGGYFAAKENAPILLTQDKAINNDNLKYIAANRVNTYLIGGESVINNDVLIDINLALRDPIELKGLFIEGTSERFAPHKIKAEINVIDEVVYKFYLKHESDTDWTVLQDYAKNNTINWVPEKEGNYEYKVQVKYENSKVIGAEESKTIKIEPLKPAKINSLEIQGNKYEKNEHIIMADASSTNSVLYKFYIQDKKTGQWTVIQDYSENNTVKWTPKNHGEYRYTVRVKDVNSDRDRDDLLGYDITINPPVSYNVTNYNNTLKQELDKQTALPSRNKIYKNGKIVNASRDEIEQRLDPTKFLDFEPKAGEQHITSIEITTDNLNVRSKPDIKSSSIATVKKASKYIVLDQEQNWFKINVGGKHGWVSGDHLKFTNDVPKSMYQFMVLTGPYGATVEQLNHELKGKGILEGQGAAFIEAARKYNVNEIYLVAHALHETGNGTSKLATGIEVTSIRQEKRDKEGNIVKDKDGNVVMEWVEVEPKVVYNMYGVQAFDETANRSGSQYAYEKGWFNPEIAIKEGAHWISENYINSAKYNQNTLYKMKFNAIVTWHQYATDIGWIEKQADRIDRMMRQCKDNEGTVLKLDIPKYKGN